MPCSARSTSTPARRLGSSLPMSPPGMAAVLDLSNEIEREVRAIIERFHTGRWPLFRCHAMRRVGSVIYEVAQWNRARGKGSPPAYSLVTWDLTTIGLRWLEFSTLEAAREAFAAAVGNTAPKNPATPAAAMAAL